MSVVEAPDGVRIGTTDNDRLAMKDFDEWVFEHQLGVMSGNEVRVVTLGETPTFRAGQNLVATLMNPGAHNAQDLLIQHVWLDALMSPPVVKARFRNLNSSSVDFENDQVTVGGWNTLA